MTPHPTPAPVRIVFACRQNAGRSQLAAASARAHAPAHVSVESCGSEPASDIHPVVAHLLAERGWQPSAPRLLDNGTIEAADWVITMGCGETCPIYPGTNYRNWDIADPHNQPEEVVRGIMADIESRVLALLAEITPSEDPQR